MPRRSGYLLLVMLWAYGALPAQERALTQYQLQVFRRGDGLPGNAVHSIAQTTDGYLWFATVDGLARFDGISFTPYTKDNTPEMRTNSTYALISSRAGGFWLGLQGGGVLGYREGRFTAITMREGLVNDMVSSLHEQGDGTLWIGTAQGLDRLAHGKVVRGPPELAGVYVRALAQASDGALWIGTEHKGLYRLAAGRLEAVRGAERLRRESIRSIVQGRDGVQWIGTARGLFRYREALEEVAALKGVEVRHLFVDRAGALWLSTGGAGLMRLSPGDHLERMTRREGMTSDVVDCAFEDREGIIWVGADAAVAMRKGRFLPITTRDGLSGDIALPITEDHEGTIWVGTFGSGLNRIRGDSIRVFRGSDGIGSDFVLSLASALDRTLWIGTRDGLSRLKDGRFERYRQLPRGAVVALLPDRGGGLWAGTTDGLWEVREGSSRRYAVANGLRSNFVYALFQDSRGDLWVGTNGGGLNLLRAGRLQHFDASHGLGSDVVVAIHEDGDGAMWIATSGGLTRMRDGRFVTLTSKHGLFDDMIYRIFDDGTGHYWFGANRGVSRVPKADLDAVADGRLPRVRALVFDESDGLPASELNGAIQPAGWQDRQGRLWFPTMKGVGVVDPRVGTTASSDFPVLVERVLVDDRPVAVHGAPLELPAGTRRIEFDYAGLSFVAPKSMTFEFQLVGYDPGWVSAGTRRSAFYTNLPHGSYRFRVRARNLNGGVSTMRSDVALVVRPHVYETWPFRGFVVLLLVGGVVGGDRVRVRLHRRRVEELMALAEERERAKNRYRDLFENASDVVLTADLAGRVETINGRGAALLGVDASDGTLTLERLTAPESHEVVRGWLSAAASGRRELTVHGLFLAAADGRRIPAEASVQAVQEDGSPIGLQAVIRDVTVRESLEQQLRQSQRLEAVGQLAGGIAHDFNNLLTVILGTVRLLLDDLPAASPHRADAQEIETAANRAASLTQQLLAFSRKQVMRPQVVDVNEIVREVAGMLARTLGESVRVVTDLAPDVRPVKVDPGQVHQVLMNLAVNARDAMPDGGVLMIETRNVAMADGCAEPPPGGMPAGAYLRLRVRDTGVGMSSEVQAKVYEPFFTTKEMGKGTGLGLSTVYGIVQQSGGFMRMSSREGEGTVFDIFFPEAPRPEAVGAPRETPPVAVASAGETILLVEDDLAVGNLLRRVLEREGYTVLTALHGAEALAVAERQSGIDLVITDVVMPVMGGTELVRRLRQRHPEVRVLFMSGYAPEYVSANGLLDEDAVFMQKPAQVEVLRAKVQEALSRSPAVHGWGRPSSAIS